jgi:diguanylate cyclase (GGDEF)-like protein
MISRLLHFLAKKFPHRDKNLDTLFKTIDLEVVLSCILNWLNENVEAENIIWIRRDEYEHLHNQAHGVEKKEADQSLHRSVKFSPVVRVDEAQIFPQLGYFTFECVRPEIRNHGKNFDILYPFFDIHAKVVGYVLVIGINKSFLKRAQQKLEWISQSVVKHIGFAFDHWRVQSQSYCDDLTGLYNQKFLSNVVESEISRSNRLGKEFSVLFLDIDHFKSINDQNGHWVGSKLLTEVGHVLRSTLRKNDYAFRYGGDEFVAILPDTSAIGGEIAAERVRRALSSADFIIDGVHLKLTASIGLAAFPEHAKTYRDIIRMADTAMYCGKNKSRNVVFVANS